MKTYFDYANEPELGSTYIGNGEHMVIYTKELVEKPASSDDSKETVQQYECDTIVLKEKPTYANTLEAIIRETYSESEEYALLNGYNEYKLGIHDDETKEQEYLSFLTWRRGLKTILRTLF